MTTKPVRRWFQFSMRTFLLTMLAICLWLGVAVLRARDQAERVASILGAGGGVYYEHEWIASPQAANVSAYPAGGEFRHAASPWPAWMVEEWRFHLFHKVKFVDITWSVGNSDFFATQALGIRGLEYLRLGNDAAEITSKPLRANLFTDAAFASLDQAANLKGISLMLMTVGDKSFKRIAASSTLEQLMLYDVNLNDTGLRLFESSPRLRDLRLHDTDVTQAGLKHFQAARPDCKVQFSNEFYR